MDRARTPFASSQASCGFYHRLGPSGVFQATSLAPSGPYPLVLQICRFAKEQPVGRILLKKGPLLLLRQAPGSVTRGRSFPKIFYLYLAPEILREDIRLEGWFSLP